MGTTCSALLLLPQGALIAHVGDSRVYRCRRGKLEQLSFDHSLVWEMQQATHARVSQELPGIPKNVITRSIGPHATVKVDLEGPFPIELKDLFLVCSDGLTGRIEDQELASALTYLPPEVAGQFLVDLAVLRGGKDNITLTLVHVLSDRLTTQSDTPPALTISNGPPQPTSVWLGFWIGLGLSVLLSIVLFAMGQFQWAWIALASSLISAAGIMIQKYGMVGADRFQLKRGSALGEAPYTMTTALSRSDFCQHLQRIADEGRLAAQNRHWDPEAVDELDSPQPDAAWRASIHTIAYLAEQCRKYLRNSTASARPFD
jgi:protein phosphatase